jgi:hypothetical protein
MNKVISCQELESLISNIGHFIPIEINIDCTNVTLVRMENSNIYFFKTFILLKTFDSEQKVVRQQYMMEDELN